MDLGTPRVFVVWRSTGRRHGQPWASVGRRIDAPKPVLDNHVPEPQKLFLSLHAFRDQVRLLATAAIVPIFCGVKFLRGMIIVMKDGPATITARDDVVNRTGELQTRRSGHRSGSLRVGKRTNASSSTRLKTENQV